MPRDASQSVGTRLLLATFQCRLSAAGHHFLPSFRFATGCWFVVAQLNRRPVLLFRPLLLFGVKGLPKCRPPPSSLVWPPPFPSFLSAPLLVPLPPALSFPAWPRGRKMW